VKTRAKLVKQLEDLGGAHIKSRFYFLKFCSNSILVPHDQNINLEGKPHPSMAGGDAVHPGEPMCVPFKNGTCGVSPAPQHQVVGAPLLG
jgi:hypothetical protein